YPAPPGRVAGRVVAGRAADRLHGRGRRPHLARGPSRRPGGTARKSAEWDRPAGWARIVAMRRIRVALAQVNPTVGAIEANARLVIDWMERARGLGADIVAFPELTLTGYPPEDLLFKPAFIEANRRALADVAAQSRGLTAVVGFVDKDDDTFNAAAMLHDGAHVGTYHKQYLPNYGVFDENRYFQAGTESPVFTLGDRVLAANICEDIWYPTGPTTVQALAGADLVISINASPFHAGKAKFREKMLATRAADDLVCLAFVNTVGGQ